ncbi:unannotated protein [freshwater metagenome]
MIRCDRRDATPVVDPSLEESCKILGQVRRSLQVHLGRKDEARKGESLEVLILWAGWCLMHRSALLRKEVLHDDFLDMPVTSVRVRNRLECVHPVISGLTNTNQDSCSKWNL